ncbi:hypothetical protein PRUPE_2G177300 [Prunus persica]|uniref:Uncharacterized protein n=1 Tax=Prunus persica TaxID=3760 RepID=A0A251QHC7_PRUPE|nr:hypothetical protein PRUPE_2G177300 [Prunus persica]
MMEGNLFGMKTTRIGKDFMHLHQSVKFQQKQSRMLATFNFFVFLIHILILQCCITLKKRSLFFFYFCQKIKLTKNHLVI